MRLSWMENYALSPLYSLTIISIIKDGLACTMIIGILIESLSLCCMVENLYSSILGMTFPLFFFPIGTLPFFLLLLFIYHSTFCLCSG